MPAGNDKAGTSSALAELADAFGDGVGSAEQLISASRQRYSGRLGAAQTQKRDEEASDALDLDEVSKSAGVEVDDASVRGAYVVASYVDESGRRQKLAFDRSDLGKAAKSVEKDDTSDVEVEEEPPKKGSRSKKS